MYRIFLCAISDPTISGGLHRRLLSRGNSSLFQGASEEDNEIPRPQSFHDGCENSILFQSVNRS